jgi:hypothetical protein
MERFNLKKLNEVEGKEQYRAEISNTFCSFGKRRGGGTIRENIKIRTAWRVYVWLRFEPCIS